MTQAEWDATPDRERLAWRAYMGVSGDLLRELLIAFERPELLKQIQLLAERVQARIDAVGT